MLYRKSKKILIYFFLFLLIGTLNNKNLSNFDLMRLDKIIVNGLDEKNNFEINKTINSLNEKNLFFLNKLQIEDVINSNNLVEKFYVFKHYPSTLIIKIDKTKFLAQIKNDHGNFFLGSNGKLIKSSKAERDVPFIFGKFENKNFFELKKAIDETNFEYTKIKNLFFFKSGRWDIETKNGVLIRLPEDNVKKSLELINIFFIKQKEEKIYKIDLRQKNQIIING